MSLPTEGCEQKARTETVVISNLFQESFFLYGNVKGVGLKLLVDTGAAASLLDSKIWSKINEGMLEKWEGPRLVGVDGSPLKVLGRAKIQLNIGASLVTTSVIITDNLTSDGILGMDFLQDNSCTIDIPRKKLILAGGTVFPLCQKASPTYDVRLAETTIIPPRCEIEVVGKSELPPYGLWLLEGHHLKSQSVVIARAILETCTSIPVRVLNASDQSITFRQGTTIGELHRIEEWQIGALSSPAENRTCLTDKANILHQLAQSPTSISDEQRGRLFALLQQYADVFACPGQKLGQTSKVQHAIHTSSSLPIRQHPRRTPPAQRTVVKKLIKEMMDDDIIQPSKSGWASPIVLAKKKDGSVRFCVDYRKLNEVTRKDAYPLPRIDDTLEMLSGSQLFSTLDLASGYWQVELEEEDRAKTAFCTNEGLFEFKVMPFGLCNAPATFQRLMDVVLSGLQWTSCLVYLDDIIVMGRTFEEHLSNLDSVFARIREAGMKIKPAKCVFLREKVQYLGHIVSKDGIEADPDKLRKVQCWPTPRNVREVQQFLGLANYYRRFIRNFAEVARPLHRLTERSAFVFQWTIQCQESFNLLRELLSSPPILSYPDFKKPFILDTDASNEGIGAVLSQLDNHGREYVIAYGSRLLSKAERNYCATRKELLAVVAFVTHFRPYLLGQRFQIRTDHGALKWLYCMRNPEAQVARWLEKLQEFDFEVIHRRGLKHINADALSRRPCTQCGVETDVDGDDGDILPVAALELSGLDIEEVIKKQSEDSEWKLLIDARRCNTRSSTKELEGKSVEIRRLWQLWDQLVLKEGVLYRKFADCNQESAAVHQLVVPPVLRNEVLREVHEGTFGGHLGEEKTFKKLRAAYYWPGYYNATKLWCKTCVACAQRKTATPHNRAPLQSVTVGSPMQMVAIDILGPLPKTAAGNRYVLVAGDYFTKWIEAYPIQNQEASTVAQKLLDQLFCRFSLPERLHSDQGRQFEAEIIKQLCKLLQIEKTRTTPYHPQSDGFVERFNRTLLSMLSTRSNPHSTNWDEDLSKVCMAYNTSIQSTTGYTPFFLMFGREARLPLAIVHEPPPSPHGAIPQQYGNYVQSLQETFNTAFEAVRSNMSTRQGRQKEFYNCKVHGDPFKPGDLVWLFNEALVKGESRKLRRPWRGPYRVITQLSDVTYRIQHTGNNKSTVVHFDRLKRCPSGMRLQEQTSTARAPPGASNAPSGTHVEPTEVDDEDVESPALIDDEVPAHDEDHTPEEDHTPDEDPAHEEDMDPTSRSDDAESDTRRYPTRTRRPPDRLQLD